MSRGTFLVLVPRYSLILSLLFFVDNGRNRVALSLEQHVEYISQFNFCVLVLIVEAFGIFEDPKCVFVPPEPHPDIKQLLFMLFSDLDYTDSFFVQLAVLKVLVDCIGELAYGTSFRHMDPSQDEVILEF